MFSFLNFSYVVLKNKLFLKITSRSFHCQLSKYSPSANLFFKDIHMTRHIILVRHMSDQAPQPERKYKNPVNWLPFPWHRRPRRSIFDHSCDTFKRLAYDPNLPKPDYELSEELKNCDEVVRKQFTLETASTVEIKEAMKRHLLKRVQQHPLDLDSLEVKIVLYTIQVQALFEHTAKKKKESRGRKFLVTAINRRNGLLNQLRKMHIERYEWLCQELQINYKPPSLGVTLEKYCKKWDLRRLTREYCENMIAEKRHAYHEDLKVQQKEFLKEKEEILAWIEKEEKELGVHESQKDS